MRSYIIDTQGHSTWLLRSCRWHLRSCSWYIYIYILKDYLNIIEKTTYCKKKKKLLDIFITSYSTLWKNRTSNDAWSFFLFMRKIFCISTSSLFYRFKTILASDTWNWINALTRQRAPSNMSTNHTVSCISRALTDLRHSRYFWENLFFTLFYHR